MFNVVNFRQQNNVGHEVGTLINMGALAVSQLLENSQERGVELILETAEFENQVREHLFNITSRIVWAISFFMCAEFYGLEFQWSVFELTILSGMNFAS